MEARHGIVNRRGGQSNGHPIARPKRYRIPDVTIGIYLLLAAISLAVFGQTIRYGFVNFDDDLYVYDAHIIKAGLTIDGIAAAFITPHARNWHPLTTISHMLDCQLYGLNSGGHHVTNTLLHTLATLLLFRVLQQMTGAVWKSALVAALFAVHPLHVESVAWISERKDVLSAVFFFLMLSAYARYARAPSIWRYLLVAGLFAAGLMSKPMLVSAPVILLLLDYWPLGRMRSQESEVRSRKSEARSHWPVVGRLVLEKIPLLVLSAGSCAITFLVQKRATGAIPPLPLLWRMENAVASYMIYIWKTFWPTRLAVFYPHPNNTLPVWGIAAAVGFLLAITIAAIALRGKRPYLFTGWFWYLVMLVPVIGLVQVGEQGYADRYTYLPHVGLFLLAVWGIADVTASWRPVLQIAAATGVVIVIGLACAAFIQTSYWRNSEILWTHALAVTSDNDFAHNNLGYLLVDQGELDDGISHFEAASRIRSRKTDRHYNAGSAFVEMNLADALARKGQSDEAMVHYNQAMKLEPNYADAYYNRGNILFAKGRIEEAIADWEKTLQLQPNDFNAHTCLANALLRQGLVKDAIAHYETALALAPDDPHSRNNIAWVLATSSDASIRDGTRAVDFAQQAVALSGGREPQFLRTLAAAYAESGRFSEAIVAAQQAAAIANMQGKTKLANNLARDLVLYRGNLPLQQSSVGD
jgi:tetratricopeptide (TPR) repeat protein